jgi:hypothetical protein
VPLTPKANGLSAPLFRGSGTRVPRPTDPLCGHLRKWNRGDVPASIPAQFESRRRALRDETVFHAVPESVRLEYYLLDLARPAGGLLMLHRAIFLACLLLFTRCESAPDEVGNDPRPGETVEVPTYKPFWDGHRWGWYR